MSRSNVDNRSLTIAGALMLVIGFAVGALTMALMRPPVRIEQAAGGAPVTMQVAQAEPQPQQQADPNPKAAPKLADTKDVPAELVAFIRERLEKNTNSGQWEEIEWEHHVGEKPEDRISPLWLPIAVGGHAATVKVRTFNGGRWTRGWIAAAHYDGNHFDWCGNLDNYQFDPDFSMPSKEPLLRNDGERAEEMIDKHLFN